MFKQNYKFVDAIKAEERKKWREAHPDSESEEESEEEPKQRSSKVKSQALEFWF